MLPTNNSIHFIGKYQSDVVQALFPKIIEKY